VDPHEHQHLIRIEEKVDNHSVQFKTVLVLLKQIKRTEDKILATTKDLLDEVNAATDTLVTAVNDGFKRLEDKIAAGGQVTQADLDEEKAILAKLGDEAAKAGTEGV